MFTQDSEFYNFVNQPGLLVSEITHNAIIDVNENGTEAAAVTRELQDV